MSKEIYQAPTLDIVQYGVEAVSGSAGDPIGGGIPLPDDDW